MTPQPIHEMYPDPDAPGPGEVWFCPICGRRMRFTDAGMFDRVLVPGDQDAHHFGGTGGLAIGAVTVAGDALRVFAEWAEEIDLDAALDSPGFPTSPPAPE